MYRFGLVLGRKLDRGNPNPGNIGSDFQRLGLSFWPAIDAHRPQNGQRRALLQELNDWRKAITPQDFTPALLRGGRPTLLPARVQARRKACDGLLRSFDEVMYATWSTRPVPPHGDRS
jgi:hypothetical protein